tara:strand:- start:10920 stop:11384 length:465 start_codon:yes stop_codon:yes gene_type:complete
MKEIQKLSIGLLLVTVAICLFAFQKEEVPQNVLNTFTKMFPTAKKNDWSKESDTEWEVEFHLKGVAYSANFLTDGTWQETEHEIKKNSIPKNIMNIISTEFPNYKIEEAEISETNDRMVYEFEIEKGEVEMEITITKEGHIIKKEERNEENEKK